MECLREGGSETSSIGDTTSSNNHDRLACQGRLVVLAGIKAGGNEHGERGVTCVPATFTTLSADDINTNFKCLLDMLRGRISASIGRP